MAIYVPASRRRRTTIAVAVVAVLAGIVLGFVAGRATSSSLGDQVGAVQDRARTATSQLRVVSLHQDEATGGGNALALQRARTELADALDDAPWVSATTRKALLAELDDLVAQGQDADAGDIESAAKDIDAAFGND
jgi:formiminotetrahydrofolate cyclodeaminase